MGREFFYRECLYETRREEVGLGDDAGVGGLAGSEDLIMPNVSEYRHVAFPFHDESRGRIPAAAGPVFAHLDDQIRLAAH
ncbi:MAG TPA: hypothetical protein VFU23_17100, partial [Gemmatimonadales bacterium]|nr:hypothetical protein [Gemmatimonadales bacterium]